MSGDPVSPLVQLPQKEANCLATGLATNLNAERPTPRQREDQRRGAISDGGKGNDDGRHLLMSAPLARTGPMRLRRFEYECFRRRRVERHIGEHLECNPVQVRLSLPFHRETALQMLCTHHILQCFIITICPEAENNKGLPEDRMLCF